MAVATNALDRARSRRVLAHERLTPAYGIDQPGPRRFAAYLRVLMLAGIAIALLACSSPKASNPVAQGHAIYVSNCTQCHNPDPNLPGLLGPPVAGSSRELIRDRLANLSYPPGYRPKRNTHQMRAFPELAPDAGALAAFLRSVQNRTPPPSN
ncbi:MAG TPA: hypothetical protein VKV28_17170 [Candidatus Binataceae bacterium]|nr:hypothetical protein [Candidatus Binataceae bacterium]